MQGSPSKVARWSVVAATLACASSAAAGPSDLLLFPTQVTATDKLQASAGEQAQMLDQVLEGAAPDLDLTLVRQAPSLEPDELSEESLPGLARSAWVVVPTLTLDAQGTKLRLTAVAPGTRVLLTRVQRFQPAELELKAVVMLQELVQAGREPEGPGRAGSHAAVPSSFDTPPPSDGEAVLALNTTLFGGYVGFTAHRASGSDDTRLLYPLVALGAGLGLGASMLVADEWNITEGTAWYLSAGLVWPTLAGISLAEGYDARPEHRHLYGLLGATSGLTLATTVASLHRTTRGQAALAHSGGAFGTLLGGLTEALVHPTLEDPPLRGIGYGSAAGVLLAGALAPVLETSPSRVLFVDLSASLGALTGAAVSAPVLLVGDEVSDGRRRVVVASVMGGAVLGGAIGIWMTHDEPAARSSVPPYSARPAVGVIGMSETSDGTLLPLYGAGLSGTW
ncbi:MAG TPA: hypothetical protein VFU02_10620 [Polyangiaceae bacterium]|nr:hypothetical protein [Polyangiaceae bacterium]